MADLSNADRDLTIALAAVAALAQGWVGGTAVAALVVVGLVSKVIMLRRAKPAPRRQLNKRARKRSKALRPKKR